MVELGLGVVMDPFRGERRKPYARTGLKKRRCEKRRLPQSNNAKWFLSAHEEL
jgi:hypothetical protein